MGMHRPSFVTGLIAGGVVAVGIAVSIPGIVPRRDIEQRSNHQRGPVIVEVPVHQSPAPARFPAKERPALPVAPPAEKKKPGVPIADKMKAQRLRSNEWAAIATLRNITSAQAQFQATARADENRNGVGEYGSFAELSGAVEVREGVKLNPPVLSRAFRNVRQGRVKRAGYYYRIFLPRVGGGRALAENDHGGFLAREVDPAKAETTWCCYAWPVDPGVTGRRTFFVNQAGDILANVDRKYGGEEEPEADAAFDADSDGILGNTAVGKEGRDRGAWKQAG